MKSLLPLVVLLAGCPSEDATNAPVLWLALDGGETNVRLAEEEPEPF